MDNNKKNTGLGIATFVALVGITIGRRVNPKVQIVLLICSIIYLITSFAIGIVKKKHNTPNYIYIGSLGVAGIYLLYLTSNVYLKLEESIQEWLLVLMIIPIVYLVAMSINLKLKSGDKRQIEMAKKGLIFLGLLLIMILLIVVAYFMK